MAVTYAQVRDWVLALPGGCEVMVESWGHPTLRVGDKMFAGGAPPWYSRGRRVSGNPVCSSMRPRSPQGLVTGSFVQLAWNLSSGCPLLGSLSSCARW